MLKSIIISGFKSFAKKTVFNLNEKITAIVGPNGCGKSNIVEAIRFALGEQSFKSLRGKTGFDLIFQGSKTIPRQNKASVSLVFDNRKRIFKLPNQKEINLNFDEITITREIWSDNISKYYLCGQEVRLKDIQEMLALANIGKSGYQIISQGKSDEFLNASPHIRKEIIEESLGLRIFYHRIKEGRLKIKKAEENIKEINIQRKEIYPQLNFLKKQVEKIENLKVLKEKLKELYQDYLRKENYFLKTKKTEIEEKEKNIQKQIKEIEEKIKSFAKEEKKEDPFKEKKQEIEEKIEEILTKKEEIFKKIGRLDGLLDFYNKKAKELEESLVSQENIIIKKEEVKIFFNEILEYLDDLMKKDDVFTLKNSLLSFKEKINNFARKLTIDLGEKKNIDQKTSFFTQIEELQKEKEKIKQELMFLEDEQKKAIQEKEKISQEEKEIESEKRKQQEKIYELNIFKNNLLNEINILKICREDLRKREESFKQEINEGNVLLNFYLRDFISLDEELTFDICEEELEQKRKEIEKLKIKIEENEISSSEEILKEYQSLKEKDDFLKKEIDDLNKSIESLKMLEKELKEEIEKKFKEGLEKINIEFQNFFNLIFGGGKASLTLQSYEEINEYGEKIKEEGINISVSLPRKKIKGIYALSGGERSLVSIALLFALAYVNPPPFLILDETDAALDEVNSQKYRMMLEKLSEISQLILVTHNRETMSCAKILYGVLIGEEGYSKVLSVKLEEAIKIAK